MYIYFVAPTALGKSPDAYDTQTNPWMRQLFKESYLIPDPSFSMHNMQVNELVQLIIHIDLLSVTYGRRRRRGNGCIKFESLLFNLLPVACDQFAVGFPSNKIFL